MSNFKPGQVAAAEDIINSLNGILDVPACNRTVELNEKTSDGIRQAIKSLEDFIVRGSNSYLELNELLSNIFIRFTSEVGAVNGFTVPVELSNTLKGKSGEHFVAGELFRRNAIVAVPPQNTPLFDLIVSNPNTLKTVYVQVKTAFSNSTYGVVWQLTDEFLNHTQHTNLYVVLVDARKEPEYFVFEYNELVDILNTIIHLPDKKSNQSGKRIFLSFGDIYHEDIYERFNKIEEWNAILDNLQ